MSGTITTSRRLMTNTILNMSNQALTVLVNFAMVGFFLDTLGEERYGVWILVGSIFSYRSIMSMGLNSAVNRRIPAHLARQDFAAIRQVVSTAFAYYLAPAAVLSIATLAIYFNIEAWFSIPDELVETAEFITLIVGLSFAITVPLQVYNAVLSSYQRYDLINLISVTSLVIRTFLVVAMLSNGFGLPTLAILYACSEIGIRALSTIFGSRLMSGIQISPKQVDRALLGHMMTYGVSTILYMSGAILVFKSADLVIAALISTSAVSRFFIATTPVLLLTTIVQVFSQAMKPAVSELDALDDHARIEEMALVSQKFTLFAILPGLTFILVMGQEFLSVWVGSRFPDPEVLAELSTVLQILGIGAALRLTQHTNFIVLVGKGRHRAFGIGAGLMIFSCVLLETAAVLVFDGGLVGVALGCCLPMAIVSTVFLPAYFNRRMQITFAHTLRRSWFPATCACLPAALLLVAWKEYRPPTSWIELFMVVVATAFATGVTAWLVALEPLERARIRRILPI